MEKFVPSSARDGKIRYAAISAHKDDMEMFAFDGIVKAYDEGGFAGIVLTDGANCPRSADYADVGGEDMTALRSAEQKRAAEIGRYSELWLLDATSDEVKSLSDDVVSSVAEILRGFPRLDALYLHNPFDRHPTHVGAFVCAIKAVRMLKNEEKPRKIYACEVWRDLDWPSENDKVALDVGGKEFLAARLMDVFVSQNSVKRYDVAALARRRANATFSQSHEGDETDALIYALDATELAYGENLGADIDAFSEKILRNFRDSLHVKIWQN